MLTSLLAQTPTCSWDAHAEALDTFISGFPTYAPLLRRIKCELDSAVDRGVTDAKNALALREQLRSARLERDVAVARARHQVRSLCCKLRQRLLCRLPCVCGRRCWAYSTGISTERKVYGLAPASNCPWLHPYLQVTAAASVSRRVMHGKLAELEARAVAADARALAARAADDITQEQIAAAEQVVHALYEVNGELKAAQEAEADWCRKYGHACLMRSSIGPVTSAVRHRRTLLSLYAHVLCRATCVSTRPSTLLLYNGQEG